MNTFAESLRGELKGTGVNVTLLAPGPVRHRNPGPGRSVDRRQARPGLLLDLERVHRQGLTRRPGREQDARRTGHLEQGDVRRGRLQPACRRCADRGHVLQEARRLIHSNFSEQAIADPYSRLMAMRRTLAVGAILLLTGGLPLLLPSAANACSCASSATPEEAVSVSQHRFPSGLRRRKPSDGFEDTYLFDVSPGLQRRSGIGDVGGDTRERERLWHKLRARHRAADVRFCAVRRRRRARGATSCGAGYRNRVRHPSGGRVRVRRRLRPECRRNSVRWCVRRPIDGHRAEAPRVALPAVLGWFGWRRRRAQ